MISANVKFLDVINDEIYFSSVKSDYIDKEIFNDAMKDAKKLKEKINDRNKNTPFFEKFSEDLFNALYKVGPHVYNKANVAPSLKIENDIFKLIDYIGEKNSSSAVKILNDMINEGESVLGIFAMINRQFKTVLQVKELLNKGLNNKSISEKLKTSLFIVNKSIKISKNFTEDMIIDMLNYILESDYKIKNGLMRDTLAIEMLVSKYCQRRVS